MTSLFPPTRAAGLARLAAFTPYMGRPYTNGRNTDLGTASPTAVSMLSPYLRRRLITEAEVVAAAMGAHGELAEKFIHEVAWRSYFKGWLEQHPSVWTDYQFQLRVAENQLATASGLRCVYHDACEGRTGIDGFDDWAKALVADGWLHNHARMWFASIWIFTLRLPWALGAAFFLRHLLDGDPASNTLSWRWVGGLHTKGKHYVARAENIARYTEGRFNPVGQLDEAPECLVEQTDHALVPIASPDALPRGDFALLLHDEDLSPHSLGIPLERAQGFARFAGTGAATPVDNFVALAMDNAAGRLERDVVPLPACDVEDWVRRQTLPVVAAWAPIGATATVLQGLPILYHRRAWDSTMWPHARKGFFGLKQRLPELLRGLTPSGLTPQSRGSRNTD